MRGGSITALQLGFSLGSGLFLSQPVGSGTPQVATQSISPSAATPGPPIELEGGANPLTSEPVLSTATTAASTTTAGTLSRQPTDIYLIQFYSVSQVFLPIGQGEIYLYVGSVKVTTSADGIGAFSFASPTTVPVGESIAATATLLDSSGDLVETSEFSAPILVLVGNTHLQVAKVTTMNLLKGRTNEGVSTINIVFNEAMAPLADSSSFYSLVIRKTVRVHHKTTTELVPVSFTASASSKNGVSLKLAKPSTLELILTVRRGNPAANGQTLGEDVTFTL
ncbi:MAG TPA: hypothetical protein VKA15_08445, partial [Isosphaeraceae bacterium]|nr:hypothetical protein [Isosphaeraceae bacterium]